MSTPSAKFSRRRIAVASVCTVAGIAVAAALGAWQLQRLAWKETLIAKLEQRTDAAPLTADEADTLIRSGEDAEYVRVRLDGWFDHEREMRLYAPGPEGPGRELLTPLHTRRGIVYVVNRGYVAETRLDEAERPEGDIGIVGVLRPFGRHNAFTPDNDPAGNIWYWYDYEAMVAYLYETWRYRSALNLFPYVVEAEETPGAYPAGGVTRREIPNNHLQYALTWFGLGLALAGVYAVWLRGQLRKP